MKKMYQPKKISNDFKAIVTSKNEYQEISQFTVDILKNVLEMYSNYFGNLTEKELKIVFDRGMANPMCLSNENIIFLTCEPQKGNQLVYQFAHELCHFCICDGRLDTPFLWLEESICEMASYYFLLKIGDIWKENIYYHKYYESNTKKPYYNFFHSYAKNEMKKAIPFDIAKLTDPNNPKLKELSETGTNRNLNAYITMNMLPIFQKYPSLWKHITYLNKANDNNLELFFTEWYYSIPKYLQTGMRELLKIFGINRQQLRHYLMNH